jgi:hypothetical protein
MYVGHTQSYLPQSDYGNRQDVTVLYVYVSVHSQKLLSSTVTEVPPYNPLSQLYAGEQTLSCSDSLHVMCSHWNAEKAHILLKKVEY